VDFVQGLSLLKQEGIKQVLAALWKPEIFSVHSEKERNPINN
jgi:hypothetical protein